MSPSIEVRRRKQDGCGLTQPSHSMRQRFTLRLISSNSDSSSSSSSLLPAMLTPGLDEERAEGTLWWGCGLCIGLWLRCFLCVSLSAGGVASVLVFLKFVCLLCQCLLCRCGLYDGGVAYVVVVWPHWLRCGFCRQSIYPSKEGVFIICWQC